jgi:hypothetical protein
LARLRTLKLSDNSFGKEGAKAFAESKNLCDLCVLDISGIADMTEELPTNIGDEGAESLAGSKFLSSLDTLQLRQSHISDKGAEALAKSKHLSRLRTLDISGNWIRNPRWIIQLCERLLHGRLITCKDGTNKLRINVSGNPLCWSETESSISEETLKQQDPEKLLQLLMDSRPGVGEGVLAARATMVGLGMSGKTRLSRWLVDHPQKENAIDPHDRTIGIEPLEMKIDGKQFGQPALGEILLTILDCGGQQEQLQSHHNLVYKASGRSLFILCLHAGKDFRSREGNRANYYLRMLQSYRGYGPWRLPVLIVVTHGELTGTPGRKLPFLDERELGAEYEQLRIVKVDPYLGHEGKKIEDVKRAIVDFLAVMPEIRALLPKGFANLLSALRQHFQLDQPLPPDPRELRIQYPSLSPAQFSAICVKNKLADESLHGDYLRNLVTLGVAIAPGVEKTVSPDIKRLDTVVSEIFNPRYVNQYVYGLLMNNRVREQKGFLSDDQFRNETTRLTEVGRNALRKLLKMYLVAFEWKHGDEEGLLIPDLLPERALPAAWSEPVCTASIDFRGMFLGEPHFFEFLSAYKFAIMPLDLTEAESQMLVRPMGVFRNEICVRNDPCEALVQLDLIESRILVTVRGGTIEEAARLREQVIGNLTRLHRASLGHPREGDAVVITRWQIDPALTRPKRTAVGKGKHDLAKLQLRIERWVERHGFPWPQKLLAIYFRCPENSLSVLVKRSRSLKAAKYEQKQLRALGGRQHQNIEGAVLDGTKDLKAVAPEEQAALKEAHDAILHFSREEILSELCSYAPGGKMRQDARKLIADSSTETLRQTLAWQRVNSSES